MVTTVGGASFSSLKTQKFICITDAPYLAVGDGATDNTVAFTTALATGNPILVPAGTFIVSTLTIPSSANIFGVGPQSILKTKAGTNASLLYLNGVTNVNLRDLAIDGNKANQVGAGCHGILISGGSGHMFESFDISNTLGDGINIAGAASKIQALSADITGFVKSGITLENCSDITLQRVFARNSDAAAFPGDGFAIAPAAAGNAVSSIVLVGCRATSNVGRGFACVGNGSKNVSDVLISSCIADTNTSHGFHALTAQNLVLNGITKNNSGDGFRLEGDVIQVTVQGIADTNTGYGAREIVSGSTPNYNTFIAVKAVGNVGSNTVTKVGASSTILV